jgi:hypothetical protein
MAISDGAAVAFFFDLALSVSGQYTMVIPTTAAMTFT